MITGTWDCALHLTFDIHLTGYTNSCGLIEVDFIGPKFTWIYQRRGGYQIRERLDRALVNSDWAAKFPMAKLLHKSSSISDHCPLILGL